MAPSIPVWQRLGQHNHPQFYLGIPMGFCQSTTQNKHHTTVCNIPKVGAKPVKKKSNRDGHQSTQTHFCNIFGDSRPFNSHDISSQHWETKTNYKHSTNKFHYPQSVCFSWQTRRLKIITSPWKFKAQQNTKKQELNLVQLR